MITFIKGKEQFNAEDAPSFFIDGVDYGLKIFNGELYINKSKFSNIYTALNVSYIGGKPRAYYRFSVNNKLLTVNLIEVENIWNNYINSLNNISLYINGAEICRLSLDNIASKLGVSTDEAKQIIRSHYDDVLLINE